MNPTACAVFLMLSFVLAGVCQTIWLRCELSKRFMIPIDLWMTYRGIRVFGDNKTLRGFIVMIPAAAGIFFLLRVLSSHSIVLNRLLWALSPYEYALLGLWAGLGFMLGELPNSFIKRQLGIAPGTLPAQKHLRALFLVVDRTDSIAGMLIAVSLAVPVPWETWLYIALLGPVIHLLFSIGLYRGGVKTTML